MISTEKYKAILDEGLLLDHYVVLCSLKEGKELVENKRIAGFINLLQKKGYIDNGKLTDKAIIFVGSEKLPVVQEVKKLKQQSFDYAEWVITLHRKCEERLFEKTGNRQVRDKVHGKAYPFLPNSTDLGRVILRAVNQYKINNFDKIETTILKYIDRCAKANSWFPILGYYIMKGDARSSNVTSMMVTDMESGDDESTENPSVHIV